MYKTIFWILIVIIQHNCLLWIKYNKYRSLSNDKNIIKKLNSIYNQISIKEKEKNKQLSVINNIKLEKDKIHFDIEDENFDRKEYLKNNDSFKERQERKILKDIQVEWNLLIKIKKYLEAILNIN